MTFAKITLCAITLMMTPLLAMAQSPFDMGKPFGFATRSSRTDKAAVYKLTGGGTYSAPVTAASAVVTLTADGGDMKAAIEKAVRENSVVVLDGSNGDFVLSSKLRFENLKGKTLLGVNGARLCTMWHVTPDMVKAFDSAGVRDMSTSKGGGTLTNGKKIKEEAEYKTRQILIDITGDAKEQYRKAGVMALTACSNFIVRNLQFVGPGALDISGSDLVSFSKCTNMWVDHCDFVDGADGNFDISDGSDFITVSWCKFFYTSRSYDHQNTNLVGSDDKEPQGTLNVTFAYNMWGENCRARMPMARDGKIHMLSNYYDCKGNANVCINPRDNSEFLVDANYFETGIKKVFAQKGATAWVWSSDNFISESKVKTPQSKGTVTVPYDYTVLEPGLLPSEARKHCGATLFRR